ncbi:hypothetical protein, partial [Candidatus Accumulibacter contiguus]
MGIPDGDRPRAEPGAAAYFGQPRHLAFIGLALVLAVGCDQAGRKSWTVIDHWLNPVPLPTWDNRGT